jgi:hypothetical protein
MRSSTRIARSSMNPFLWVKKKGMFVLSSNLSNIAGWQAEISCP